MGTNHAPARFRASVVCICYSIINHLYWVLIFVSLLLTLPLPYPVVWTNPHSLVISIFPHLPITDISQHQKSERCKMGRISDPPPPLVKPGLSCAVCCRRRRGSSTCSLGTCRILFAHRIPTIYSLPSHGRVSCMIAVSHSSVVVSHVVVVLTPAGDRS